MTLLLDFDNTIVNTLPLYRKAHNKLLNQNISQKVWDKITQGLNVHQAADVLDKHFGIGDKEAYIIHARDEARNQIMSKRPNENIIRVLQNNKNTPIYVLSGNDTNLICNYIKRWNLPINPKNVHGEMRASDKLKFILNAKKINKDEMYVMIDDNKDFITYLQKNFICSAIYYRNQGVLKTVNRIGR